MTPMVLYHRTTADAVKQILANGFRDGTSSYMAEGEFTGVWVSLRPLDCNEGAGGDALLELTADFTIDDISEYEWVEDGKSYREWLLPASLLNSRCKAKRVE